MFQKQTGQFYDRSYKVAINTGAKRNHGFYLFLTLTIFLLIRGVTIAHAETKFGFDGNEFDAVVVAYGMGKRAYAQFSDPISYSLKINKLVDSQKIVYRVRFIVNYEGDWRLYDTATKKGGAPLETFPVEREVTACSVAMNVCWYIEIFDIQLSREDFLAGIAFQVQGSSDSFMFNIPEAEAAKVQEIADKRFPDF